jgi:hypothetical protein
MNLNGYLLIAIWLGLGLFGLNTAVVISQEINATTEDGRHVLLNPDGTWKYLQPKSSPPATKSEQTHYFKPKSATALLKGKRVKYGLWYDRSKWLPDRDIDNTSAEYELTHVEGDRYVVIIPERLQIPLETLEIAAIANAKKAAPDTRITFEEKRIVNDREILCLRMDATIQGIPVSYINYYYSGKAGAVQLMTYTGQNLIEEYQSDMLDLLNGFEVYE